MTDYVIAVGINNVFIKKRNNKIPQGEVREGK